MEATMQRIDTGLTKHIDDDERRQEKTDAKLDRILWAVIASLGSTLLAVIGGVVTFLLSR
jgi:hypothetical protein